MITYYVSLAGEVVANLLPTHAVGGREQIIIPATVAEQGVHAVQAYVRDELLRLEVALRAAKVRRREVLLASTRRIAIEVEGVSVVGELRYDERPRALFTVRLLEPATCTAETTIYGSAARGQLKGNETHSVLGEWLPSVVEEARTILVQMYRDELHRQQYASEYKLVGLLNPQ